MFLGCGVRVRFFVFKVFSVQFFFGGGRGVAWCLGFSFC